MPPRTNPPFGVFVVCHQGFEPRVMRVSLPPVRRSGIDEPPAY